MNWNNRIRQTHRWLSVAFTLGVLVNTLVLFAVARGTEPPFWVYLLALLPLFTLLLTGWYLFALPYLARWRSGRRTA